MEDTQSLDKLSILEIGAGTGSSTAALAEQGAKLTALDISAADLELAEAHMGEMGLSARFEVGNAAQLSSVGEVREFEQIVFWAVLEHMTIEERLAALAAAWDLLDVGGLLTVVETPNRLWPLDTHTSLLPFFSWLPYELAYRYSPHSPRAGFGDRYLDAARVEMEHFLRRGHGVSFHEFDIAIGDHASVRVESCMQHYWRSKNALRRAGWQLSRAGRTERTLAAYSPRSDHAWLQPFLYLTLRKT